MSADIPVVSVVIPCYNQGKYLSEAVSSVQAQSRSDWECIIVNDGSSDHTRDIALGLVSKDVRISYIEQANGGLACARNRGLDLVRGAHVQFLDADDQIAPDKFEKQLALLECVPGLAVSYSDYMCYSDDPGITIAEGFRKPCLDERQPELDIASHWGNELCIPVHSFLFDARIFSDYQIRFDEELSNHEDFECWLRVFSLHPKILYVDDKLAFYRWHKDSATQSAVRMMRGYILALSKARSSGAYSPEVSKALGGRMRIVRSALRSRQIHWRILYAIRTRVRSLFYITGRLVKPRDGSVRGENGQWL